MSALTSLVSPTAPTHWPTLLPPSGRGGDLRNVFVPRCDLIRDACASVLGEAQQEIGGTLKITTLDNVSREAHGHHYPALLVELLIAGLPQSCLSLLIFPSSSMHPSKVDAMQELSDNTWQNRCKQLWGSVALLHQAPKSGQTISHDERDVPDMLWLAAWVYFELYKGEEGLFLHSEFHGIDGKPIGTAFAVTLGPGIPTSESVFSNRKDSPAATSLRDGPIGLVIHRSTFWQSCPPSSPFISPWVPLQRHTYGDGAYTLMMPSGTLRNAGIKPVPGSIVYRRYIPEVAQHLSYRMVSIGSPEAGEGARDGPAYSRDVQLCAKWQNSDRVHAGWRQRDPAMSAHFDCIKEIVDDPARFGLIGYWDDEPWGFVEIYFAKESNVAPFYQVADRDMGFHALVGEAKYRGAHRVRTWMGAAVHLCFLLDPQTQLVVSEPRASNTKMVEYECMVGGHVEKLIDLGHKRSALVMIPRERFFQLCPMGPLPQQMEAAKAWEG